MLQVHRIARWSWLVEHTVHSTIRRYDDSTPRSRPSWSCSTNSRSMLALGTTGL